MRGKRSVTEQGISDGVDFYSCTPNSTRECSIDLGPCTRGIQECQTDGTWSSICSGVVPQPEICDGIDNNCNSAVDEGVLNRCRSCGPEPVEICDGLDNDCDGAIDERDVPLTCGIGVCAGTSLSVCEPCLTTSPPAAREDFNTTCTNGLDDDCDGLTDVEDLEDCARLQGGGGF